MHSTAIKSMRAASGATLLSLLMLGCGRGPNGGSDDHGPLVDRLSSSRPDVRREAAEQLGELRQKDAVRPLIRLLYDVREDVRLTAASALGRIGDRSAAGPLTRLLQAPGWRERKA